MEPPTSRDRLEPARQTPSNVLAFNARVATSSGAIETPLRIVIGHPSAEVWAMRLTTLYVDRLDFDLGLLALRGQHILDVGDLNRRRISDVVACAGFDFRQARHFLRRLEVSARARLERR